MSEAKHRPIAVVLIWIVIIACCVYRISKKGWPQDQFDAGLIVVVVAGSSIATIWTLIAWYKK